MSEAKSVAIYGLGIIGSRCAENLLAAGYQVSTWNRTPGKHPKQIKSASSAASADILCFYLKDGKACREVFNTIKDNLDSTKVLINHSTVDLESTLWLAEQCEQHNMAFLDCPFTGSKDASSQGTLIYYVGGKIETLEKYRKLLEVTSKEIHHLGKVGDATIVKITTNLISASTIQAISEAMAISKAHGIDLDLFTSAVSSNACSSALSKMKMTSMSKGEYDTHFSLDNMLKDSRFALVLAEQKGLTTPGIATTSTQMSALSQAGHGNLDYSSLFRQFDSSND